jgi:hypothetical protein
VFCLHATLAIVTRSGPLIHSAIDALLGSTEKEIYSTKLTISVME